MIICSNGLLSRPLIVELHFFQDFLGTKGLASPNILEQQAAIDSLSTLMTIVPNEIFLEFQDVCFAYFF